MKFLTIKVKITLWYTFFMVVLVSSILGIMAEFTDNTIFVNQKKQLIEATEDAAEDIEEGDDFDYFEDGVYLVKYGGNQEQEEGNIPNGFPVSLSIKTGQVQKIDEKGEKFFVYDKEIITERGETVWIRGIVSDVYANELTKTIMGTAFILLPVLVILSSIIGYFITKRAFNPVKKIQETAQNITESNQLSLRIGLPEGKDEISMLGKTIDNMLARVEKSFEQEKQFTSDASHELRTPVAVILSESEYILKHGTDMEEAKESMEVINRQAEKMSALINQLLFFSRAEQGRINLNYEKFDIIKATEEIVNESRVISKEKNIRINIENSLKNKSEISADKILFSRAVQNIIQNAITYGRENGYINIKIYENSDYFAIETEDNGIGISQENIDKIWDRFYQADEARTGKKEGGMGLGLSMVKWITEKHGGYAKVKSSLNKGSVFTLYFPSKN